MCWLSRLALRIWFFGCRFSLVCWGQDKFRFKEGPFHNMKIIFAWRMRKTRRKSKPGFNLSRKVGAFMKYNAFIGSFQALQKMWFFLKYALIISYIFILLSSANPNKKKLVTTYMREIKSLCSKLLKLSTLIQKSPDFWELSIIYRLLLG